MWRRGADKDGNVANFVETEQVLEAEGFVASYVQVHFSPAQSGPNGHRPALPFS
jgi:hypothetical protein